MPGASVYPPASAAAFNTLLFQLLTSPHGQLKSHTILFYLVLADSLHLQQGPALPTSFARTFLLPTGFVRGIEGFHALDSGAWRAGVAALTDPHGSPDFVNDTLQVLSTLPPVEERAGLVLSYWRLGAIPLQTVEQVGIVLDALCDQERKFGVVEAWSIQRKWADEEQRKELVLRILGRCFGGEYEARETREDALERRAQELIPRFTDNANSLPVAHHLQALLAHPFTSSEDALSNTFCLSPSSASISTTLTADWRLSKYIAEGRPSDALRFWSLAKSTVKPSDERTRLLKAVHATLTEVERNTLALEADDHTPASTASTSAKPSANIIQPAWQPVPLPAPTPLPRSLLSLHQSPAPAPQPTASDLPLSASPFLRREKPLVSSFDGSALGGAQKSVLRALKEGTSPTKTYGSPSQDVADKGKGKAEPFGERRFPGFGGAGAFNSPSSRGAVVAESSFGGGTPTRNGGSTYGGYNDASSAKDSPRRPTLSGFGSVRLPASASYGKARDDSMSLFGASSARMNQDHDEDQDEDDGDDVRMSSPPPQPQKQKKLPSAAAAPAPGPDSPATFGLRVTKDPTVAATLAAAASPAPAPVKRRTASASASRDKRRAVSTEVEDRPSSVVRVNPNANVKPPGAFPGGFDDGESDAGGHDQEDSEGEGNRSTSASRTKRSAAPTPAPTRRSARASSVQPSDNKGPSPSTPRPKAKKTAATTEAPASAIRRSSRLQTPAKEEAPGTARKGTARKSTRGTRKVIEEEE